MVVKDETSASGSLMQAAALAAGVIHSHMEASCAVRGYMAILKNAQGVRVSSGKHEVLGFRPRSAPNPVPSIVK